MLISSLSESLRLFVEIAEAADGYEQTLYIIPGGITPLETEAMQHVTRVAVVALYDNSFLAVGYILISHFSNSPFSTKRISLPTFFMSWSTSPSNSL